LAYVDNAWREAAERPSFFSAREAACERFDERGTASIYHLLEFTRRTRGSRGGHAHCIPRFDNWAVSLRFRISAVRAFCFNRQ
jgi:hypothetical protein